MNLTAKQREDLEWCVNDMEETGEKWSGYSQGFITLPNGQIAEVQIIVTTDTTQFIDVTLLEHR